MLLAIDTATRFTSLALYDGRDILAEHTWRNDNNFTVQLAPMIQGIFETAEASINDLAAVAVSVGPGSYTGLRVGVSLAKGIAAARKLPLIGVTTLQTLAAAFPLPTGDAALIAIVQAGRGRVIHERYQPTAGRWRSVTDPALSVWDTLVEPINTPTSITGEIDETGHEVLSEAIAAGKPITIAAGAVRLRRAGVLAEIAWGMLQASTHPSEFAADRLSPVYVKSDDQ